MDKKRVLILCTGNACRSQLAEAMVNHTLGDEWQAFSAGTHPKESIHPLTLRALDEIGIQHHGEPKAIDRFFGQPFDVVITVCDDSAENCPVWLGQGRRVHIGFTDPAEAQGSDEQKMAAFRSVRDEIQSRLVGYLRALSL